MKSQLEQLKKYTVVVADTGDIEEIKKYNPEDATTNPSLLLKAAKLPIYSNLVKKSLEWSMLRSIDIEQQLEDANDKLSVLIGKEILDVVPGTISTEVDARLSFDTEGTISRARKLINLYEEEGISKDRVLIKIAATWEGIKAAEALEKEGIRCNLTLIFNFTQAKACAEANVYLISPFVGRILDWFKREYGEDSPRLEKDPGVVSVTEIYNYFKYHGYKTIVMGASFRNKQEVIDLAGCDRLTIGPALLEELKLSNDPIERKLLSECGSFNEKIHPLSEKAFRGLISKDPMTSEKLNEGINGFISDQEKLNDYLISIIKAM